MKIIMVDRLAKTNSHQYTQEKPSDLWKSAGSGIEFRNEGFAECAKSLIIE
jgi:hypothetical protein